MTLHRGRLAINPEVLECRPLTREDLAQLPELRAQSGPHTAGGHVARLRDPHHRLARLIAAGLRPDELVARSGYSAQRIVQLKANQTFQELIETYRGKVTAAFEREQETFIEIATKNMLTAERMLEEKLEIAEEEGTLPSIRELMSIRSDSADRLGYGKKNTTLNVNVDFAAKMEAAIQRTRSLRQIEAVPLPSTAQSPAVPDVPASSAPLAPLLTRRA